MKRRLILISGYRIQNGRVSDKTLRKLVVEYSKNWDEVVIVSQSKNPATKQLVNSDIRNVRIIYVRYTKSFIERLLHAIKVWKRASNIADKLQITKNDDIQFRFPNYFVLMFACYFKLFNIGTRHYYIAGDEVQMARYNYPYLIPLAIVKRIIEKRIIGSDKVITAGDRLAKVFSKHTLTHSYYSTTHDVVFKKEFTKDRLGIVFIGSLFYSKRCIDVIHSLQYIDNLNGVRCDILGTGPLLEALRESVEKLGLDDVVTFHGHVESEKVLYSILDTAGILIFPSLTEGSPRVLPECMSRGVIPIAVGRCGSNSTIIENGVNGLLVDAKSPYDIAQAVMKIRDNDELYKRLLQGVHDYAISRTFTIESRKALEFII